MTYAPKYLTPKLIQTCPFSARLIFLLWLYTVEDAGGKCLPCVVDVRDEKQVATAVQKAVEKFGGIDIVINNCSAISLTGTLETDMKKYDLMNQVNARGTFLTWVRQYLIIFLTLAGHFVAQTPTQSRLDETGSVGLSFLNRFSFWSVMVLLIFHGSFWSFVVLFHLSWFFLIWACSFWSVVVLWDPSRFFFIWALNTFYKLGALSIHINNGETICIPFTTAQRFIHR